MNKTSEFFLREKDVKISKQSHAYRDYVSTCNVDTLYSFSHELEELINVFFELRIVIWMTYLNKVRLYQTHRNIMENVPVGLLIPL